MVYAKNGCRVGEYVVFPATPKADMGRKIFHMRAPCTKHSKILVRVKIKMGQECTSVVETCYIGYQSCCQDKMPEQTSLRKGVFILACNESPSWQGWHGSQWEATGHTVFKVRRQRPMNAITQLAGSLFNEIHEIVQFPSNRQQVIQIITTPVQIVRGLKFGTMYHKQNKTQKATRVRFIHELLNVL